MQNNRPFAVVFGDSITQQGFILEQSGWVCQLADYWTRKVDVINRGYSGYNTRLGLAMIREVVIPLRPAFVTVFLVPTMPASSRPCTMCHLMSSPGTWK